MKLIESKTLASAAASIEFTSIPQTFTDLVILTSLRSNRAANIDVNEVTFNSDFGSNYTYRVLAGTGSSVFSETGTQNKLFSYSVNGNTTTTNTFNSSTFYIPNYTSSVVKSISEDSVYEDNVTQAWQNITAYLWNNTAAITSLRMKPSVGTEFMTGSMVSLYGVLKGSDGIVTTS